MNDVPVPITRPIGTAALAQTVLGLSLLATPVTASQLGGMAEQEPARLVRNGPSRQYVGRTAVPGNISASPTFFSTSSVAENYLNEFGRATTAQEELIGEIRSWSLWDANWDGERAKAPLMSSLRDAVEFVRLIDSDELLPEAMLFASGRSGLYWHTDDLYADLEFLGEGRIAYFMKINGDQHKGIVGFDPKKLPTVFQALLLG